MSKRPLFIFLGLGLLLTLACFIWWVRDRSGINRVSFDRIQPGMNESEVKALLGERTCLYREQPGIRYGKGIIKSWKGENLFIHVEFDAQGNVLSKISEPRCESPWSEKLLLQILPGRASPPAQDEGLLRAARVLNLFEESNVTQMVENCLAKIRSGGSIDPEGANELLRSTLLHVRDHPDLSDDIRAVLMDRLEKAAGQ